MPGQVSISALAGAYRRLVLWFGAQLILNCGAMGAGPVLGDTILGGIVGLAALAGMLVTIGALAYYGYRTALALGSGVAWLWALAMFVPCANAITLLVLSSRATQACAAHGIPVGLLGPKVIPPEGTPRGPGEIG
jgi:hypothetical protein